MTVKQWSQGPHLGSLVPEPEPEPVLLNTKPWGHVQHITIERTQIKLEEMGSNPGPAIKLSDFDQSLFFLSCPMYDEVVEIEGL